jgi:hypothetical protein
MFRPIRPEAVVKGLLTPRELAEAIGVSESSLKRWADAGLVKVSRTGGGHRRITLAEAIRFVRETRAQLVRPDLLGLPTPSGDPLTGTSDDERLFEYLQHGHGTLARSLIMSMYLGGHSVAEICDGPLRTAMARIGELWRHSDEGVFYEHRATDICVHALAQLRLVLDISEDAPAAVGSAPPGDPYVLPSMMAALVVASEGLNAVNLGANTPFAALRFAMTRHEPRLVWLAVTSEAAADRAAEIGEFGEHVSASGAQLVIGGRFRGGVADKIRPTPHIVFASSMAELASYARRVREAAGADGHDGHAAHDGHDRQAT